MHLHVEEARLQRTARMVVDEPYFLRLQLVESDEGFFYGGWHLVISAYAQVNDKRLPVLHHRQEAVLHALVFKALEDKGYVFG